MNDHGGSLAAVGAASRSNARPHAVQWVRFVSLVVMAILMVRLAWLSDDSLITLRTALNTVHGFGFGFNSGEAVQAYTHPLWFLVWTGAGALFDEWILSILVLSVVLSITAAAIVLWRAPATWVVVAAASSLVLSNAFMEYATSGLENPLAYGFAAAAIALTARGGSFLSSARWMPVLVGLCMAGLILTRFDLTVIVLPVGAVLLWQTRRTPGVVIAGTVATGVPLVLWLTWSWSVYRTVLPNTFEAKRNLDIPQIELAKEGIRYLVISGLGDMWTVVVLALGLILALMMGSVIVRAWAMGAVFYLLYVVLVGGDFMAGRFLAVPVLIVVACGVEVARGRWESANTWVTLFGQSTRRQLAGSVLAFLILPIIILTVARTVPTAITAPDVQRWDNQYSAGVADERGFYLEINRGISDWLDGDRPGRGAAPLPASHADPAFSLTAVATAARMWPDVDDQGWDRGDVRVACGMLGSLAISTGPGSHWIDECGLTDAFIAGQAFSNEGKTWRPGHYARPIPDGYVEAVETGQASRVIDPELRQQLEEVWARIR